MSLILESIRDHISTVQRIEALHASIASAAELSIDALQKGGKLLLMGNGGSAADAQHIAAELVGRYKLERKAIAAIAITTDPSIITAIGNDYGSQRLFSRQVEALANPGDVVFGISTSGNSANVIEAVTVARALGCLTIGLLGNDGGRLKALVDLPVVVDSRDTPRIQECHILIGHILCDLIEKGIAGGAH